MKKVCLFVFSLILFLSFGVKVQALTGTVNVNDALYLRKGASSTSDIITSFSNGTVLTILDTNGSSCDGGGKWYKVSYGSYTGYVCGTYVVLNNISSETNNEDDSYDRNNYSTAPSGDGTIMCYEDTGDVTLRTSANGSYGSVKVSCGEEVTINSVVETNNGYWWYHITSDRGSGYINNIYVNTTVLTPTAEAYYKSNSNGDTKESYTKKLTAAGFPTSYINYLLELHARYPKWNFVAEKINLDFDDVVDGEAIDERSLLDRRNNAFDVGYLSTASFSYDILNDSFIVSDETGHYNASKEAIAYYMDPRNYLNQKYIFAFETLNYSSNQSTSLVSSIISNQSFFNSIYSKNWSDGTNSASGDIVKACSVADISALHVATRIKQEMGTSLTTTDSRLGGAFTYNRASYSGYYNFFNIKSSCKNCSSIYAGYAYENGWNTPYKGILGGANFLAKNYISINQDTIYYQKFDVSTTDGNYTHQYMQNLAAPISEGGATYTGYLSSLKSYLDTAITFVIPVYNNMPNYAVTAPSLGNPNNYLKDLTVNGTTVSQFNYATYNYNVYLDSNVSSVSIGATAINTSASVKGGGKISITSNEQVQTVSVTSQNGKVRNYTITFKRQTSNPTTISDAMNHSGFKYNDSYLFGIEVGTNVTNLIGNITSYNNTIGIEITSSSGAVKTNDSFRTGDKIKINGSDGSKTYTAVIFGDVNGDGLIDKNDLLYVQSKAFGYTTFDSLKTVAADINKDGKVDKNDLLYVQSHVFGYSKINQG